MGSPICLYIILLFTCQQTASFCRGYWLSKWADDPVNNGTQKHTELRVGVFGVLGVVQGLLTWSPSRLSLSGHFPSLQMVTFLRGSLSQRLLETKSLGTEPNLHSNDLWDLSNIPNIAAQSFGLLVCAHHIFSVVWIATKHSGKWLDSSPPWLKL